jgi:hypothetical protein
MDTTTKDNQIIAILTRIDLVIGDHFNAIRELNEYKNKLLQTDPRMFRNVRVPWEYTSEGTPIVMLNFRAPMRSNLQILDALINETRF